jgi:hypothetical protein
VQSKGILIVAKIGILDLSIELFIFICLLFRECEEKRVTLLQNYFLKKLYILE